VLLLLTIMVVACGDDDDDDNDNVAKDDDAVDDDTGDDDATDDDTADDDTADDDTADDDTADDDTADDDTADDDTTDDDTTDDDTTDDDTADDDTADDDTYIEDADYVVVGAATHEETVEPLLAYHAGQGMNAWFKDTESIAVEFEGEDIQAKIRSYLQSLLDDTRTQYALLVGSNQTLPMRLLHHDPDDHYEYQTYSDLYYSDLGGDMNADGDQYYGEYGEDEYDWTPEMHVGRLPFDDPATLVNLVDKIVNWSVEDPDYKWDALLAAGTIQIPGDSAIIMQMIDNWVVEPAGLLSWRMYELNGWLWPDQLLNHDSFVERWSTNPPGFVMWACHGSKTCAFAGDAFFCNTDAPELADDQPSVVFSTACSNGSLENPAGLTPALLTNGAVNVIASTDITHPGDVGEASLVFLVMVDHTLVQNTPFAVGLGLAKERYMNLYFPWHLYDTGLYLRNFFGFNLYGDPAMRYWHEQP